MGIAGIWIWAEVAFLWVSGWLKLCFSCSLWGWPWLPPRQGPQMYLHWTQDEMCWCACAYRASGWSGSRSGDTGRASSRGIPSDCCSARLKWFRSSNMDISRFPSCSESGCRVWSRRVELWCPELIWKSYMHERWKVKIN